MSKQDLIDAGLRALSFCLALALVTLTWSLLAPNGYHASGQAGTEQLIGTIACGIGLVTTFFYTTLGTSEIGRIVAFGLVMGLFMGGGAWFWACYFMPGITTLIQQSGLIVTLFCGPSEEYLCSAFGLAWGVYLVEFTCWKMKDENSTTRTLRAENNTAHEALASVLLL